MFDPKTINIKFQRLIFRYVLCGALLLINDFIVCSTGPKNKFGINDDSICNQIAFLIHRTLNVCIRNRNRSVCAEPFKHSYESEFENLLLVARFNSENYSRLE